MSVARPILTDLTPDKLKGIGKLAFMRLKNASGVTEEKPHNEIEFSNGYKLETALFRDDNRRVPTLTINARILKGDKEALIFQTTEEGVDVYNVRGIGLEVNGRLLDLGDCLIATLVRSRDRESAEKYESNGAELEFRLAEWLEDSIGSKNKELKPCPVRLGSSLLP